MKRSGPPQRKTELGRGKGLTRGQPPRRRQAQRPTAADRTTDERDVVRAGVFERDGHVCRLAGGSAGRCFGVALTPHHLWKSGQRGPYVLRNLVTLCGWHNDWVEVNRELAEAWGLYVQPQTEHGTDPRQCIERAWALMQLAGIVDYWWDGTPAHRPCPGDVTAP